VCSKTSVDLAVALETMKFLKWKNWKNILFFAVFVLWFIFRRPKIIQELRRLQKNDEKLHSHASKKWILLLSYARYMKQSSLAHFYIRFATAPEAIIKENIW